MYGLGASLGAVALSSLLAEDTAADEKQYSRIGSTGQNDVRAPDGRLNRPLYLANDCIGIWFSLENQGRVRGLEAPDTASERQIVRP